MSSNATIFVVDDDPLVCDLVRQLGESVGLPVETHTSALEFLGSHDPSRPGCLVLDVRMPGMSGLDLQERLTRFAHTVPVIVVTGHGDVAMAVRAVKAGAVDFIEKPFRGQELLDRINQAIEMDLQARAERAKQEKLRGRVANLTPREREVMDLLLAGLTTKEVAQRLAISPKTAQIHRMRILAKLEVESVVQLVRLTMHTSTDGPKDSLDSRMSFGEGVVC